MGDLYTYRARLASNSTTPIYDGDTARFEVDLGFGMTANLGSCRLFGIDTPELRGDEREAGLAARDFVRQLIPEDEWFTVRTHKDKKGKYGRYLVDIYLDDGTHVNAAIVGAGHGVWRDY